MGLIGTFPEVLNYSLFDRVKEDYDPFILEQRAFERIVRVSPERTKSYFPKYYGVADERALVSFHKCYGTSPSEDRGNGDEEGQKVT